LDLVLEDFKRAQAAAEPDIRSVEEHVFVPTPVREEKGERMPKGAERILMVDAALHAIDELMEEHEEAILYGQDVGGRLGGVFREAATLAEKYGENRVFNTAIQEAYIIGSTVGLSAMGMKPIVEIQFGDYIYPGFNQLVTEVSKSCYLSNGKYPVQMLLRVPVGAYGGGGPYHSGSIESTLLKHQRNQSSVSIQCGRYEGIDESRLLRSKPRDYAGAQGIVLEQSTRHRRSKNHRTIQGLYIAIRQSQYSR
jgi:2-oxoisovalerate dehydrogenase E1 component